VSPRHRQRALALAAVTPASPPAARAARRVSQH
jgi:hypothetical protein